MSRKRSRKTLSGLLWKQLTSVRLTVAVLLTIAAAAVIGTLIPQNQPPDYYREYFGERLYPVMARLDLPDMYHSLWFQTLILPQAANIPAGYATEGTWYEFFKAKAARKGLAAPGATA